SGGAGEASNLLQQAIPIAMYGTPWVATEYACMCTELALQSGDVEKARTLSAQALQISETSSWARSRAAVAASRLALHEGEIGSATRAALQALEIAGENDDPLTTIDGLEVVAAISCERGSALLAARILGATAAARQATGYIGIDG